MLPDSDVVLQKLRRFSLVFLHAGALIDEGELAESLRSEMAQFGRSVVLHDVTNSLPDDADSDYVLVGFESLVDGDNRCERLSQLRASVMVNLEEGRRVLAISRVPKARLIGCVGSQLILDAQPVFLRPFPEDATSQILADAGLDGSQAQFAVRASSGLPALISAFTSAHSESEGDSKRAVAAVKEAVPHLLTRAVRELGPEATTAFHQLLDHGDVDVGERVEPLIVEALRGSGFAAYDASRDSIQLLIPERLKSTYLDAVRTVVDSTVIPPSTVTSILTGLWEIERRLRRRLQSLARARSGDGWRELVTAEREVRERVLHRLSQDRVAIESDVRRVANPLEWMTLDELLQLIEEQSEWACPPETPVAFFRRLRGELQPVRNRAAHFRLPELRDDEVVQRWQSEVRRRFRDTA